MTKGVTSGVPPAVPPMVLAPILADLRLTSCSQEHSSLSQIALACPGRRARVRAQIGLLRDRPDRLFDADAINQLIRTAR